MQQVNLAVVATSPIARIQAHARDRGWMRLRLLSPARNTYNSDYHGETAAGNQIPALNVFVRDGETIRHAYSTELLYAPSGEGQDPRHVDSIWPLWSLFDLTTRRATSVLGRRTSVRLTPEQVGRAVFGSRQMGTSSFTAMHPRHPRERASGRRRRPPRMMRSAPFPYPRSLQ
jgi:hypothetical protein